MKKRSFFKISVLCFGYAFFYIPMMLLMVYSFNASKQISVWTGFSTKWYWALLSNEALLGALWTSLQIALLSASMAVILGTLAAVVIVKMGDFRGKSIFKVLTMAPMVLPEVILGLAFLLCFLALERLMGFPSGRGITTIAIAHGTIAIAYVVSIVRNQLLEMDPAIIEAALDLGAPPYKIFFVITLPIIAPSLVAGWFLAFILSFDDLVVASFVAGPEATTLPMAIFSRVRFGLTPEINALASILIGIAFVIVFIVGWFRNRNIPQGHQK